MDWVLTELDVIELILVRQGQPVQIAHEFFGESNETPRRNNRFLFRCGPIDANARARRKSRIADRNSKRRYRSSLRNYFEEIQVRND